jgi:hypothetical protein
MNTNNVDVGIIMGSDSDLPVMKEVAAVLEEFAVPYVVTIPVDFEAPPAPPPVAPCIDTKARLVPAGAVQLPVALNVATCLSGDPGLTLIAIMNSPIQIN